jgi:hypothetical protein
MECSFCLLQVAAASLAGSDVLKSVFCAFNSVSSAGSRASIYVQGLKNKYHIQGPKSKYFGAGYQEQVFHVLGLESNQSVQSLKSNYLCAGSRASIYAATDKNALLEGWKSFGYFNSNCK